MTSLNDNRRQVKYESDVDTRAFYQEKTKEEAHEHEWILGKFEPAEISGTYHIYTTPAKAHFVCLCGEFKTLIEGDKK